jgi:hypothetical protein
MASLVHFGSPEQFKVVNDELINVVSGASVGSVKADMVHDVIEHPSHYNSHPSGIEVIKITAFETFLRGNIIKYVLRAPYKGTELQDLLKARQYLDWEIIRIEDANR